MATSTLKFHWVNFEEDLNAYVDDLETYLNQRQEIEINDFQYIRNDLDIKIKVDLLQEYVNNFYYNYCSIKNSDDQVVFYYFIRHIEQLAENTLQFTLHMDTVNTLGQDIGDAESPCNPRNFESTTEITRQHKDRFLKRTDFDPEVGGTLYRLIDKESEGIVPDKQKTRNQKVYDTNDFLNPDAWYLVYMSVTDTSIAGPIEVYLVPEISPLVYDHTGDTVRVIGDITSVDRTDSKLVKIIKLPYCPIPYTVIRWGNDYAFDFNQQFNGQYVWQMIFVGTHRLKCYRTDLLDITSAAYGSVSLGREDMAEVVLNELTYSFYPGDVIEDAAPDINYESKLYHSDFYQKKFVYDSFSQQVNLEDFHYNRQSTSGEPLITDKPVLSVGFKPTSTINSKFGFNWKVKTPTSAPVRVFKDDEEDYDDLLLVNRNNEATIYNNEYINYIRTGYNYDQKANALQISIAQRRAVMETIKLGTDVGLTLAGKNKFSAAQIGSDISSTVNSYFNISDTKKAQEIAMGSKLAQLAAQSTSTSGSDDVDLMTWYSGNKLSVMSYEPKEFMKKKIYNMLKETGYASSEIGTPDVDSRYWYNYLQCTPHIKYEGTLHIRGTWVDDLKQRYQSGVSVFHHHGIAGAKDQTWTFDREYENWESWLLQ